jgi:hypothetical protein
LFWGINKLRGPRITGQERVGSKLTVRLGRWRPVPTLYLVRWYRDGILIRGATGRTYTPVVRDTYYKIKVRLTACRAGYFPARAFTTSPAPVEPR